LVVGAIVQEVHATGVNWDSVAVILAGFSAVIGLTIALQERRNSQIKSDISISVNHLSDVLQAKLETKETVAAMSERLARLEAVNGIGADHR
jgi:hypothetical protein